MSVVTRRFVRCDVCKREEPADAPSRSAWDERWKRFPGEPYVRPFHTCPACQDPPPSLFGEAAA